MKQEDLRVGMEVWFKGIPVVKGKISEVLPKGSLLGGCFVIVEYDPSNTILGLNCHAEADELVLYNPNEPPPEDYKPSGNFISADELFESLGVINE